MTTFELRANFHNLIDNIDNDSLLSRFYEIISRAKDTKEGDLWSKLSKTDQAELLEIEKESRKAENLISHKEMQNKHKKWL